MLTAGKNGTDDNESDTDMPLIKRKPDGAKAPVTEAAGKPAAKTFEEAPANDTAAAGDSMQTASAPPAAPSPAPAPAPVIQRSTAVALKPGAGPMNAFKDAVRVDFNTLNVIQPNQGQFLQKDDKTKSMGDTIIIELLSYQDSYVVAPGGEDKSDEAKALVCYSPDSITTYDGRNVQDVLHQMREAGWDDAKCSHRCVLAFNLEEAAKDHPFLDTLCQMDLAPTSKTDFDRHRLQANWEVTKGKRSADDIARMQLTCQVAEKGDKTWTKVKFTYAPPKEA